MYNIWTPVRFGRNLIQTGDLDPVYIALLNSGFDRPTLCRFQIAYWCYYHCGVACHMASREGYDFWEEMRTAAANEKPSPLGERWNRGAERRHFRGKACVAAIDDLASRYGHKPEDMVEDLISNAKPFHRFFQVAQTPKMFGPWIAFKIGDMLERIMSAPVNFDEGAIFMFKDPVKGAGMVSRWIDAGEPTEISKNQFVAGKDGKREIDHSLNYFLNEFKHVKAPPRDERRVGLQEIETIFCKWKSHVKGGYPVGKDIREIKEGLIGWGALADQFKSAMP